MAYRLGPPEGYGEPAPASRWRAWADETAQRFANRCLPLLMANQAGWVIRAPAAVEVVWRGGAGIDQLEVTGGEGPPGVLLAQSHFGHGILTWTIPFLFRTPPGYNLLVRGPANSPKDGIAALEGLVETDWAMSPFTMNWKVTRPNAPIRFHRGEPICMVVPQRRGELESFVPAIVDVHEAEDVYEHYRAWSESRREFNSCLSQGSVDEFWQKHYFRGNTPSGLQAEEHQTLLRLRKFEAAAVLVGEDAAAARRMRSAS